MAIGRPQVLEQAYEEMGIKIEPPKTKTEEEVTADLESVFSKVEEVWALFYF